MTFLGTLSAINDASLLLFCERTQEMLGTFLFIGCIVTTNEQMRVLHFNLMMVVLQEVQQAHVYWVSKYVNIHP